MGERSIIELVEERLENDGITLPVFHRMAIKIQQIMCREDYGARDIARVIQRDQALASYVLKVANSAFYAGLSPVKTITDATVRLGAKSIANLVMVATQKQAYSSKRKEFRQWMDQLWSHALSSAVGSRWLAHHLGLNKIAEESFLAGLLHDIGKLLLLRIIEDLRETQSIHKSITNPVILDILENMHCQQGERLMRHQNMPDVYCQVVANHHVEDIAPDNVIINLVRLANLACAKLGVGLKHEPELMLSTTVEAMNLMANDLLLAELQVKMESHKLSFDRFLESDQDRSNSVPA
ncbi:HDOD domain-containing protein [Thermodesulfobacteriota bacterium]